MGLSPATSRGFRFPGTATSLADPGADRIVFWDESADAVAWLTAGTGLTISGTTIEASGGGLVSDRVALTSADITTNSTSFVDATGVAVTVTTGARKCLVVFSGVALISTAAGASIYFDVAVDGTRLGGTAGLVAVAPGGNSWDANPSFAVTTAALTAASHTFQLKWRVSANTATLRASATAPAMLGVIELST